MSLTPSQISPLGITAPDFTLLDTVSQEELSLSDVRGEKATAIMFICNHCPYVQHINEGIVSINNEYRDKGISFVGISANDADKYPLDGPDMMQTTAKEVGYAFPYLYDETQEVAKSYGASCTPDLFIFDKDLKLVYHGQFDDSRIGSDIPVTGESFRSVFDQLFSGVEVSAEQTPSIGCSIKWK